MIKNKNTMISDDSNQAKVVLRPNGPNRPNRKKCENGYICNFQGNQLNCTDIQAGWRPLLDGIYCPSGSMTIMHCPIGSYCPNAETKKSCPKGYFCPHKVCDEILFKYNLLFLLYPQ